MSGARGDVSIALGFDVTQVTVFPILYVVQFLSPNI